jgi:hypothetical protein
VVYEGRRGKVPRPSLLAAIVGKAAAATDLTDPPKLVCNIGTSPFCALSPRTLHDDRRSGDETGNGCVGPVHCYRRLIPRGP